MKCFQKEPSNRWDAKSLLQHPWITRNQNIVLELVCEEADDMNRKLNSNFQTILEEGSFVVNEKQ